MYEVADLDIKAAALKLVISASMSLFVMLGDLAFVLRDEFKHVLSQLRSSWRSRMYVFLRSMGLLGQIFNVYFAFRIYLDIYTSPTGCYVWFSYQALIVQSLLFYVEYLLAERVLALFLGSQAILMMLITFLLSQYTPSCWVTKSSPGNAFFSATTMTTHIIIFFMTFWRFFRLPKEFTHRGLGWTVFRDSTLTSVAISVIMLFLTLTSLEVIKHSMSGNIVFSWLVCTLWVSMGHIYTSQEKIKQDAALSKVWKRSMQLTSQIEIGEVSTFDTTGSLSDGPMAGTLHGSLSAPTRKANHLSLSGVCSDGPRERSTDDLPSCAGPGSTPVGMPVDTPPSLSGCAGEGALWEDDSGVGLSSGLQLQPPLSEGGTGRDSRDEPDLGSQPSGINSMEVPDGDILPAEPDPWADAD